MAGFSIEEGFKRFTHYDLVFGFLFLVIFQMLWMLDTVHEEKHIV